MSAYVLGFHEIDRTRLAVVGGKEANLGELSSIDGVRVPDGFCVTTEAYRAVVERGTVVGVEHATTRIRDGQLIRVNGSEGYVEIPE
ncbi:PEP/pyruvate-binding domain-containing protein [Nonomuraea sp. NPDC059194]|uniref:PEP/pyruvate-binding domain-containing protein n=1 Tax=Nonomuraea sp. NPDC059194 TaxID=3346764 RepID=UPI0036BFFEA1